MVNNAMWKKEEKIESEQDALEREEKELCRKLDRILDEIEDGGISQRTRERGKQYDNRLLSKSAPALKC